MAERLKTEFYGHHTIIFERFYSGNTLQVMAKAYNPVVSPTTLRHSAIGRTKEIALERIKTKIDSHEVCR